MNENNNFTPTVPPNQGHGEQAWKQPANAGQQHDVKAHDIVHDRSEDSNQAPKGNQTPNPEMTDGSRRQWYGQPGNPSQPSLGNYVDRQNPNDYQGFTPNGQPYQPGSPQAPHAPNYDQPYQPGPQQTPYGHPYQAGPQQVPYGQSYQSYQSYQPYQPSQPNPQGPYGSEQYPPTYSPMAMGYIPRQKIVAGLLGLFLGSLGVHNFYLGFTGKAIAQLLLTVLGWIIIVGPLISGIWGLVEGIIILCSNYGSPWHRDAKGVELRD